MRFQTSDLAAMFEVYMLAVVVVGLKQAFDATGPWYTETASFFVYATTFVGSLIIVSVVLIGAIVLTRSSGLPPPPEMADAVVSVPLPLELEEDDDVEGLLTSIEEASSGRSAAGLLAASEVSFGRANGAATRETLLRRAHVRKTLVTLTGPGVAAAIFGGIGAALLPGAAGVLQTLFTLNTFVIITLSWGWLGLIPYTIASVFLAASES